MKSLAGKPKSKEKAKKKEKRRKNPEMEKMKKYWLPGQRHQTPNDGDPTLLFYTSLLKQIPKSRIA